MTDLTVVQHCTEMQQLYVIKSICYYLTTCRIKMERVVFSKRFFFLLKLSLLEFSHPNILFHKCSYFYNMSHCFNSWRGFT